jgi:FkbM family methyltransferase
LIRSRLFADRRVLRVVQAVRAAINWLSAPSPAVREWRARDGDKTLRLDYDLSAQSTVLDVGGFEGQWASDVVAMYGCRVHVFEPVPGYAEHIRRRFARNPLVDVHAVGLSSQDESVLASIAGDASSHHRAGEQTVRITLRCAAAVIDELALAQIDLMKVNIEGAEYDLLDHMISSGRISKVRDLQVQFHAFVPRAAEHMAAIRRALEQTHYPTYAYDFHWENWRRREG